MINISKEYTDLLRSVQFLLSISEFMLSVIDQYENPTYHTALAKLKHKKSVIF